MDFIIEKVRRSEHSVVLISDATGLNFTIDGEIVITISRTGVLKVFEDKLNGLGIAIGYVREDKHVVRGEKVLEEMSMDERNKLINTTLRKLLNIKYDSEIDEGETHGKEEQKFLHVIDLLLDTDYNCFDEFVDDLIYHIREEKCMEIQEDWYVKKDTLGVYDKLIMMADRDKKIREELDKIEGEWEDDSYECEHNSNNWSDEKLEEHSVGMAGPCQHPKNPHLARVGNCCPEYCPLRSGEHS